METENNLGRRNFLKATCGLATIAAVTGSDALAKEPHETPAAKVDQRYRFTLDRGYRAPRSGLIATLKNGDLLWITTEPEAPYLSKSMRSLFRLAMQRSAEGGKSVNDSHQIAVWLQGILCGRIRLHSMMTSLL